jgi:hypothetical protein
MQSNGDVGAIPLLQSAEEVRVADPAPGANSVVKEINGERDRLKRTLGGRSG